MAVDITLPQLYSWEVVKNTDDPGEYTVNTVWASRTLEGSMFANQSLAGIAHDEVQAAMTAAYDAVKADAVTAGFTFPTEPTGVDRKGFDNDADITIPDP